MSLRHPSSFAVLSLLFVVIAGCGSSSSSSGTGGATGTGGSTASGGTSGSGGRTGTGGSTVVGSGGSTTPSSSGGAPGTGGGEPVGMGGRAGNANGGAPANGGATGNGGRGAGPQGGRAGGGTTGAGGSTGGGGAATASPMMNFFVSSDTSMTANLGGLMGADARCQRLATAVGQGSKTWHAYLSAENPATNAIDRIGAGPYFNSAGAMVAADKAALHVRTGDSMLFLTERQERINGQWVGSPTPNQHDILTGSQRDGTVLAGTTCGDWTATTGNSQVGHADGLGPNQATTGNLSFWNSAHTGMCGNTMPGGGAGRIYCFVAP